LLITLLLLLPLYSILTCNSVGTSSSSELITSPSFSSSSSPLTTRSSSSVTFNFSFSSSDAFLAFSLFFFFWVFRFGGTDFFLLVSLLVLFVLNHLLSSWSVSCCLNDLHLQKRSMPRHAENMPLLCVA